VVAEGVETRASSACSTNPAKTPRVTCSYPQPPAAITDLFQVRPQPLPSDLDPLPLNS
jgi:hypothetical protein